MSLTDTQLVPLLFAPLGEESSRKVLASSGYHSESVVLDDGQGASGGVSYFANFHINLD